MTSSSVSRPSAGATAKIGAVIDVQVSKGPALVDDADEPRRRDLHRGRLHNSRRCT